MQNFILEFIYLRNMKYLKLKPLNAILLTTLLFSQKENATFLNTSILKKKNIMKFLKLSFLIAICFFNQISFSQNDVKRYHLTHQISPSEKEAMKTFYKTRSFSETAPPTGEVRNIAEWEPMESVIVAYDGAFGIPLSLIAEMSEDCNITTIVANSSEENSVRSTYNSNSVNLSHCNFVYQDPDSWWTRDYSPWFIAVDNSDVAIVNFPYNRPRPNDNDVPILMANSLGIDLYGMDVTHTGGNYMCDGYGAAASTDLLWDEESQTHEQILSKMQNYLGITNCHVTADPLDDYIKHIDCWGKFLDVDKILITQVPSSDYRYDDYEAIATYFSQQNCSWGYPYEVIRVQAADYYDYDVNPYSNLLILNKKVFVPQTGSALDDDAIATYEAAMPGYEIIGVYSSGWYNTDALHCRTHGVADREMLYIKHIPLHGTLNFQNNFTVEAEVYSYGGSAISSGFPKLFYKQNLGDWQEVVMTNTTANTYTAQIPGLRGNNDVEYYISAQNENGKTETNPIIGSADPFTFSYLEYVSVKEFKQNNNVNIFPNPSNGKFVINCANIPNSIEIYDVNGKIIFTSTSNSFKNNVDISDLKSGIYFVNVEAGNDSYYKKMILK